MLVDEARSIDGAADSAPEQCGETTTIEQLRELYRELAGYHTHFFKKIF